MVDSGQFLLYNVFVNTKREDDCIVNERVFKHQLDAKNRMRLPAKLKEEFPNGYTITLGTGGCLSVISREESLKREEELKKVSPYDALAQKSVRLISMNTWDAEEDGQGRILIPENIREFVHLKKNLLVIKSISSIEIWAEEVWNEYMGDVEINSVDAMFANLQSVLEKQNG